MLLRHRSSKMHPWSGNKLFLLNLRFRPLWVGSFFPGKLQIATFGQSVGQVWFELHPLDNRALSKPCDIILDDSTVCESCTVTVSTALFTLLKLSLMIPIVRPACVRHCGSEFLEPQHYHYYSWCDNTLFLSATLAQHSFRREFLHWITMSG